MQVRQGDRNVPLEQGKLPVALVLDRLRSAYNVGNLFRVSEATRAEKIIACGYTAAPPHPKLEKTARGCDSIVPCEVVETGEEAVRKLKAQGYTVYAVETVEGASMYYETEFKFPCALVLGNEALGISEEALALCDGAVALPALGLKNSINVGNAGAVVLFEALRQYRLKTLNVER
ncbi:MAG: RNA methyltransferase [Victivallales bacterium]|nr:RNA methyltransferase [Victivallales bacterium]